MLYFLSSGLFLLRCFIASLFSLNDVVYAYSICTRNMPECIDLFLFAFFTHPLKQD